MLGFDKISLTGFHRAPIPIMVNFKKMVHGNMIFKNLSNNRARHSCTLETDMGILCCQFMVSWKIECLIRIFKNYSHLNYYETLLAGGGCEELENRKEQINLYVKNELIPICYIFLVFCLNWIWSVFLMVFLAEETLLFRHFR